MIGVGGHTFDETLIGDGVIIDIGCRDFTFSMSEHFAKNKVYCIDPDKEVFNLCPSGVESLNYAISDIEGEERYYKNGESTCLERFYKGHEHLMIGCHTMTMGQLYKITGFNVDLLKLDCEGAEYIILGENFLPVPKQITVEWHAHMFPQIHMDNIAKCLKNLEEHYNIAYQCESGMDTLFIKKNL